MSSPEARWVLAAALVLFGTTLMLLAGRLLWRALARRWRRHRRGLRVRGLVVLAHGVLGFDSLTVAGTRHEYFRGLAATLEKTGARVVAVRLPATACIADRAARLSEAVRAMGLTRVNIIAHSMGGLDSRFAISRLGLARYVASLTTLGTPHRGTPIADLGTDLGDKLGLRKMVDALKLDVEAFYDLTTTHMAAFNGEVRDAWRVHYGSYVGICPAVTQMNPLLVPTYYYLARCAGENDGLVPASSQAWGEVLGRVEADHWAQIGWGRAADIAELYAEMLHELAARGF